MAQVTFRDIIEAYINDGRADFMGLPIARKHAFYAELHKLCKKMTNKSKAYSIYGLMQSYKSLFVEPKMADPAFGTEDRVKDLFKVITNNNGYNVEYPDLAADEATRASYATRLKGFADPTSSRFAGIPDSDIDSKIQGLLQLYAEAFVIHNRYNIINQAVVKDPIKARQLLADYIALAGGAPTINIDDMLIALSEHRYRDVIDVVGPALRRLKRSRTPIVIIPGGGGGGIIPTTGPVPPTTGPVPPTTGPVPPTTGPVPPTTGPVPPTTGPVPPTTGPVPPTTGPVPPTIGPVPPTTGPVPPTTGPVPPTTGPVPPTTGPVPPTTGPVPPTTGPVPPTTGPVTPPVTPLPPDEMARLKGDLTNMLLIYDNAQSLLGETTDEKLRDRGRQLTEAGFEERELIRERVGRIDPAHIARVRTALETNDELTLTRIFTSTRPIVDPKTGESKPNYLAFAAGALGEVHGSLARDGVDILNMYTTATDVVADPDAPGAAEGERRLNETEFGKFIDKYTMAAVPGRTLPMDPSVDDPDMPGLGDGETPPRRRRDGFFKRVGKWIARKPVLAGTVLFAAALPVVGAFALNALPSVFLWGTVGLISGNGVKALAKGIFPRYKRFLVNYDIEKQRRKLETSQEKVHQTMLDVQEILGERSMSPEDVRTYAELPGRESVSDAAAEAFGYYRGRKIKRTRERRKLDRALRELDNAEDSLRIKRSEMDLTGLDAEQIREIVRLGRETKKARASEAKAKRKLEKKYGKILKIDEKMGDRDLFASDSEGRREMRSSTALRTDAERELARDAEDMALPGIMNTRLGRWLDSKHNKFGKKGPAYARSVEKVDTRLAAMVTEAIRTGHRQEAMDYVAKDMAANGGVPNPALMQVIENDIGPAGVQYVEARSMEIAVEADTTATRTIYRDVDSAAVLATPEAIAAGLTSETLRKDSNRAMAVLYGKYYYKQGKTFEDLQHDLGDSMSDEMMAVAYEEFERMRSAERLRAPRPTTPGSSGPRRDDGRGSGRGSM